MSKRYHYTTNCTISTARKIQDMIDQSIEVTYKTILKLIGMDEIKNTFSFYAWNGQKGLKLKDDYAVSFYRSKYQGKRAYYICHSAIEYVFT